MDFEDGMDRDYGPGSYGGLTFKDIYLKILLLRASKGMDRDYGHGSYGGQRSMDSYLNQSYGMDNHSGGGGGSR
ncbi:DBIRD complex subunit ZNF326 [Camelus dromedarius]|nr:DBIRD complex subunit ZNF326 [Camelus dromedarius]